MNLKDLPETNIAKFGEYPSLFFREKTYTNVDTLPRNGVGKILKTQLRKTASDIVIS